MTFFSKIADKQIGFIKKTQVKSGVAQLLAIILLTNFSGLHGSEQPKKFVPQNNFEVCVKSEKPSVDKIDKPFLSTQKENKKRIDLAIFINNESLPDDAISDDFFMALKTCPGKLDNIPFIVIASSPVVHSLFERKDWDQESIGLFNNINVYSSTDDDFAVFIPKDYKKIDYDQYLKETKDNQISYFEYIGLNDLLKSNKHNINEYKGEEYKLLSGKREEISIDSLKSILSETGTDVSKYIYIIGHGSYQKKIAGMTQKTYHEFLSFLDQRNTKFLYISSCHCGGINAAIMHPDFVNFPIVYGGTTDGAVLVKLLAETNENIFFLNKFFNKLHNYLDSPTSFMNIEKETKCNPTLKNVVNQIYNANPHIVNLPSICIPKSSKSCGVFCKSLNLDDTKIITKKLIETSKNRPIEIGKIKKDKSIKPAKYILVYPSDMSKTHLKIIGNAMPPFISKIGGNAFHIIGMIESDYNNIYNFVTKSFLYSFTDKGNKFTLGKSDKAWFIKKLQVGLDTWESVAIYRPATITAVEHQPFFVLLKQQNSYYIWYADKFINKGNNDHIITLEKKEISSVFYGYLLDEIQKTCKPDPISLKRFSDLTETPDSTYKAFKEFMDEAINIKLIRNFKTDLALYTQDKSSKTFDLPLIINAQSKLKPLQFLPTNKPVVLCPTNKGNTICTSDFIIQCPTNYSQPPCYTHNIKLNIGNLNDIKISFNKPDLRHVKTEMIFNENAGNTPLHIAAAKGDLPKIKELNNTTNVNAKNELGRTPLHTALENGTTLTIAMLLFSPENIKAKDINGKTPLNLATEKKARESIVKFLINSETINEPDNLGWTPLLTAVKYGSSFDIIKLLIINGANINAQDQKGKTPLYSLIEIATLTRTLKLWRNTIQLLKTSGAKMNTPDKNGKTPQYILDAYINSIQKKKK